MQLLTPRSATLTFLSWSTSGPNGAVLANKSDPPLEELSAEYEGKVKIVKVNVDENPNAAAAVGVRSIPALFMFKDGEVVSNKVGAAPKSAFEGWIKETV